jgi:hypothetical protein
MVFVVALVRTPPAKVGWRLACLAVCAASLSWKRSLLSRLSDRSLFAFQLFIAMCMTAIALFGRRLPDIRDDVRPEYFLFLVLGSLGLMMMVSSVELISLVISLELASCALYLLVPLRRERPGLRVQMESAAKYVMFGLIATGILLFGMSYIFGMTGSTYFDEIAPALAARWFDPAVVVAIARLWSGYSSNSPSQCMWGRTSTRALPTGHRFRTAMRVAAVRFSSDSCWRSVRRVWFFPHHSLVASMSPGIWWRLSGHRGCSCSPPPMPDMSWCLLLGAGCGGHLYDLGSGQACRWLVITGIRGRKPADR